MTHMVTATIDILSDPLVTTDLPRVEEAIADVAAVNYPVMTDLLNGIIAAKGKMLRPRIVFAVARAFTYDPARLIPAAAGLELLHIATLVHDDTVDKALFRRGAPTLNSALPTTIVVLLGDFLFAQSAVLVSHTNNLARRHAVRGDAGRDLQWRTGRNLSDAPVEPDPRAVRPAYLRQDCRAVCHRRAIWRHPR